MRDAGLTRGEATPSVRTPVARIVRAIEVRGLVQGAGFRPFVWRWAAGRGLEGSVINRAGQVEIMIAGTLEAVEEFARRLAAEPPPRARVEAVQVLETDRSIEPGAGFSIEERQTSAPAG